MAFLAVVAVVIWSPVIGSLVGLALWWSCGGSVRGQQRDGKQEGGKQHGSDEREFPKVSLGKVRRLGCGRAGGWELLIARVFGKAGDTLRCGGRCPFDKARRMISSAKLRELF